MKERVVVFGDAIIAIILTIIVLELPIQYGHTG
ncbi:MAG: TMEM175 family protein, partial [Enterococcus viikkiensis]